MIQQMICPQRSSVGSSGGYGPNGLSWIRCTRIR